MKGKYKEIIFCFIIISLIIVLNIFTENYTKNSIAYMNDNLDNLKQAMIEYQKNEDETKKEEDSKKVEKKIEEIYDKWDKKYQILAYYIEHDELEKVKTELVSLKSNIEIDEYSQGIPNIDRCIFILQHIKEKSALQIKNMF